MANAIYIRVLESTYRHTLQIENEDVYVDIMDTAGEVRFKSILSVLGKGASGRGPKIQSIPLYPKE